MTSSFTFRSTYYDGQMQNGLFVDQNLFRNTEEISVDIRPGTIERVWSRRETKWKHVIEPDIVYRYVTGVNEFGRFVRYDEDETLSDTNEFEYGITQRLFRRRQKGNTEELVTWRIAQKYFLDPTFGGALVSGQRNVFQTLDLLTPFAFADTPRSLSPLVSEVTIQPGGRYDMQFIVNFDPVRNRLSAINAAEAQTVWRIVPDFGTFLYAEFAGRSFAATAEFRATLQSSAGFDRLRRRQPPWVECQFRSKLRHYPANLPEPTGAGELQQFLLRDRIRSPAILFRHDPKRKLVHGCFPGIANLGSVGNLRRQEKIF